MQANPEIQALVTQKEELELLLLSIKAHYGIDFTHYGRASLLRNIQKHLKHQELSYISELIPLVFHNEKHFNLLLNNITIRVSDMFRDPLLFNMIREQVIPILKTYARVNIWHAGCASGEEVYSMAILLKEEGIYDKCRLYATDISPLALQASEKGIYPEERLQQFTQNYVASGGKKAFSDYYTRAYGSIKLRDELKQNVTLACHNLCQDAGFAECHLILCRNVLIYFDKQLQNHVLNQLGKSLVPRGMLVLGDQETLENTELQKKVSPLSTSLRVFQKKLAWR